MDTSETVTTETLKSIADAFNRHDLDGIMAFFTEEAILETPKGPDPWGRRFAGTGCARDSPHASPESLMSTMATTPIG